jgi:hypothetical protein
LSHVRILDKIEETNKLEIFRRAAHHRDPMKLTHSQLDELMRLAHSHQIASTPRARVQNKLGRMGLAKLVETQHGSASDHWEITELGRATLVPYQESEVYEGE